MKKVLIFSFVILKMSDNNTCHQRNKERLKEQAQNRYQQQGGKEKAK